ncbi:MAG: ribonuclease J [Epsilonproteobacteria bacterium]|nr:ribonuclease J [Campylobacterota bacterium]MBD3839146.1 ribonuclease J [Campylobacterota bacterium]
MNDNTQNEKAVEPQENETTQETQTNEQKAPHKPRARSERPERPSREDRASRRASNPHRTPKEHPQQQVQEALAPTHTPREPQSAHPHKKRGDGAKGGGKKGKDYVVVTNDIKDVLKANDIVTLDRMQPWRNHELNDKKVRFTPLGGLGEIGGNMAVLETEDSAIIIDVGMSFPDETMHGVDILIPDFSYIHTIKDKVKAIIITHAHEDHIGAVPYILKEFKFPIYGSPLALALIENRLNENGLAGDKKLFNYIIKRNIYEFGDIKVEWIHVTHSIVDSSSLAIETPAGIIIHTADFKIDHTPIDFKTTDLHRFAYYGERGVLCLFSDSTNSHNVGSTKSEMVVGVAFDKIFSEAKGRVIMSTFSSNIHRVYQAMTRAIDKKRKICVIGRSMERNIETARRLNYIDVADKYFIEPHELGKYPDHEVMVITTGSQGENMAALARMAMDEHRHIKLKPTDTVIISAHAIPGNEGSVSALMNLLTKAGAKVHYKDVENIHVSGHAGQEEQKLILRLVQPKFFLPVHGEYNHIARHAQTAVSCGVNERNILLMSDGDQIEITQKYIKKVKSVKTGKTYIDNQNNIVITNHMINDRQNLASDGVVNISFVINKETLKLQSDASISTNGLIPEKELRHFNKEINTMIDNFIINAKFDKTNFSQKVAQEEFRGLVRKYISRAKKRFPIINVHIFFI